LSSTAIDCQFHRLLRSCQFDSTFALGLDHTPKEQNAQFWGYAVTSLRSKRSRMERTKFGPCEGFFALGLLKKWGESKTVEGRGWGRGKKVTLARKPLDFEKPVHPRTGLLIGAVWSS